MSTAIVESRTDQIERARTAPPAKLAHIALQTSRLEEMMKFYQTLLSCRVFFYAPGVVAFLTFDEEHHRIALLAMPSLKPYAREYAGVQHTSFTYPSFAELLGNYLRLKEQGILPVWCTNHGPTTSMYYRDPDGNTLEMQVENFASAQQVNEFLASGDFQENPIGVDYDPDALVQRFLSGEQEQSLARRPRVRRAIDDPSIGISR